MKLSVENFSGENEHVSYTYDNPLLVEFDKPFRLDPNLDRAKIPGHVQGSVSSDGVDVDQVYIEVPGTNVNATVLFTSLDFIVDEYYPEIKEFAGTIRPIVISIEILGEEISGSAGFALSFNGKIFEGNTDYEQYEKDDEVVGLIDSDFWIDTSTGVQGFLALPQAVIPSVDFTIYSKALPGNEESQSLRE